MSYKINKGKTRYFSKEKLYEREINGAPNRVSLRQSLLWLILNLALIVQCLSRNSISFSILHTP
jgi:hypothetical protein